MRHTTCLVVAAASEVNIDRPGETQVFETMVEREGLKPAESPGRISKLLAVEAEPFQPPVFEVSPMLIS
jgi:hypothetical protein